MTLGTYNISVFMKKSLIDNEKPHGIQGWTFPGSRPPLADIPCSKSAGYTLLRLTRY